MKCSPSMMKYTGYLHILALAVAIYGTYHQVDAVQNNKPFSPALAVALTVLSIWNLNGSRWICFLGIYRISSIIKEKRINLLSNIII